MPSRASHPGGGRNPLSARSKSRISQRRWVQREAVPPLCVTKTVSGAERSKRERPTRIERAAELGKLPRDRGILEDARISTAADVSQQCAPQLGVKESFVNLVSMTMAAQPIESGRLPAVRFRVVLRMSLNGNVWIAAKHAVRRMRRNCAVDQEARPSLALRYALLLGVSVIRHRLRGLGAAPLGRSFALPSQDRSQGSEGLVDGVGIRENIPDFR